MAFAILFMICIYHRESDHDHLYGRYHYRLQCRRQLDE